MTILVELPVPSGGGFVPPSGSVYATSHIAWNGVLLGGTEDNPFGVSAIHGWDSLPGADSGNAPRSAGHGSMPGTLLAGPRTVTVEMLVRNGVDSSSIQQAVAALRRVTVLEDVERQLVIQVGDEKWMCWARVIERDIPIGPLHPTGHAPVMLVWEATDPLRYSPAATQSVVGLPQTGDGFDYPLVYPLDYGEPAAGGTVTVVNGGDVPSPPVLTIRGPASNPIVTNQTTGRSLRVALTLAASDLLTVDVRAGTVLLNGLADREGATTGLVSAFLLAPGDNELTFRAAGYELDALLGVAHRSATM